MLWREIDVRYFGIRYCYSKDYKGNTMRRLLIFIMVLGCFSGLEAKLPDINSKIVKSKLHEIMQAHVSYKNFDSNLVMRSLKNYIELLDPSKTYFLLEDVQKWAEPSDELVDAVLKGYQIGQYDVFKEIHQVMVTAIARREALEKEVEREKLVEEVSPLDFQDLDWVANEVELKQRLAEIRAIRMEALEELTEEQRELSLKRIKKMRASYEDDFLAEEERERFILSNVLKATASSLDTHTAYFTPDEATQFLFQVQQRLFGIGAQLRDDLNGLRVIELVEGGPAFNQEKLQEKDRIIAVDGVSIVGMDITEAVDLIRGESGTSVDLTIVREISSEPNKKLQTLDVSIVRGEVVLKNSRIETVIEPFGDGVIGHIRLFSFYQDPQHSSSSDMLKEIAKIQTEHNLKGLILDLRYNSGGMLSQAVAVAGLFISKGIVVSIKDDRGKVQHLRDTDGNTAWDGPLIVLTNRASASASEIVAQTLQDYGRAIVVGDDHTFGKGTFQTFTLNAHRGARVNPQGEYKVTRGTYYTVSGKSPQMTGVEVDIVVPSALSAIDIGERYAKFFLETDEIQPNFDDNLEDINILQRRELLRFYRHGLQMKTDFYTRYLDVLLGNSNRRLEKDANYQAFLKQIEVKEFDKEEMENYGQNDLQLQETLNIMKDLVLLLS